MAEQCSVTDSAVLPKHIAIIMDGNGRWAKQRNLSRAAGHKAGVEAARHVIEACAELGIEVLSLFAFSSENWQRPRAEVSFLMDLFLVSLRREIKRLHQNNIRIYFIGELSKFNVRLQTEILAAQQLTQANQGMKLVIAANYGGRWDVTQAVQQLAGQVEAKQLSPKAITVEAIARYLSTAIFPEPDLFIRTSGEKRLSNFLMWQLAYTELYFTDILWPDFTKSELQEALRCYQLRQRRFGCTSEQLTAEL